MVQPVISKDARDFLIRHLVEVEEEKEDILKNHFPQVTLESIEFEKLMAGYINGIEKFIKGAKITEKSSYDVPFVIINSMVEIEDLDDQSIDTIRIISPFSKHANVDLSCASYLSPMGKVLLLKEKGSKVEVKAPAGQAHYKIRDIKISYG